MKNPTIRIYVERMVGRTQVSLECPPEEREDTVKAAKDLLAAIPESTFTGDGVAITSIPMRGPDMDGPMGWGRPGE